MRFDWKLRVTRGTRLVCVALVVAAACALTPTIAQAQEPQKLGVAFNGDVGLLLLYVKADQTAGFEEMLTKFKDGLAKMEAPEAKQQAAGLRLLKAPNGPAPAGATLYVLLADPAVKNVEYWFLSMLYKMYPAEAKTLYDQWMAVKHAQAQIVWDLTLVMKMQ